MGFAGILCYTIYIYNRVFVYRPNLAFVDIVQGLAVLPRVSHADERYNKANQHF